MTHEPDYSNALTLMIKLVESRSGTRIPSGQHWQNDAQVLAVKLHHHLHSMRILAQGSQLNYPEGAAHLFIDHSSIKVLTRAALETYLVFAWIFGATTSRESEFRHKTWRLGGLLDRQQIHATTSEGEAILAEEKRLVESLQQELSSEEFYLAAPSKIQAKYMKGEWRGGHSWLTLGMAAGFHKKYFQNTYGYLCGYAHSSYISAIQVRDAKSPAEQQMMSSSMMGVGTKIIAQFIIKYSEFFPIAKKTLAQNPELIATIQKWLFSAEDMEDIFKDTSNNT